MQVILVKIILEVKRRKSYGRILEVHKKINLLSHELGDDCKWRLKCFEVVPDITKKSILQTFNFMASADEQDSYLCGLIYVLPVAWHCNRKPSDEARVNEAIFKYRLRVKVDNVVKV